MGKKLVTTRVTINGETLAAATEREGEDALTRCMAVRNLDLWVEREGSALAVLANGERAWVMFLRHAGDPGFSSRDPAYAGPEDVIMAFRLANGQVDEYPLGWTVPRYEALRAARHFLLTGERPPDVVWNDSG